MSAIGDLAGSEPLLLLAIVAVLAAAAGWMIERDRPGLGKGLRQSGYLAMLATGLLLAGQLAVNAKRSDAALMLGSRPALSVTGSRTEIPLSSDGHFWVHASVNGQVENFLVDTGATFTGLSRATARAAGIEPSSMLAPVELETANGTIMATMGVATSFEFGTITVRDLPVAVPKDFGDDTNVIGMNLLSRMGSWRVEGDRLVLDPPPPRRGGVRVPSPQQ